MNESKEQMARQMLQRLTEKVDVAQQGPELCQGHIPLPEDGPKAYQMCYMELPCPRAHLHEDTGQ